MKRILTIIALMAALTATAQVSDPLIKDTIDLYIYTNGTKAITAAQMNKILTLLNDNKLNKDSIDAAGYWTATGGNIANNNAGKVTIDSLYLYPLPDEATRVGRIPVLQTDGKVEWCPPLAIYDTVQEELAANPGASPYAIWVIDTLSGHVTLADTANFVGIGITDPGYNLQVRGSSGFYGGLSHFGMDAGVDLLTIDPVAPISGTTYLSSVLDSNYFAGAVVMDSTLNVNDKLKASYNGTFMGYNRFNGVDRRIDNYAVIGDTAVQSYVLAKAGNYIQYNFAGSLDGLYQAEAFVNYDADTTATAQMAVTRDATISSVKVYADSIVLSSPNIKFDADITYDYYHIIVYTTGGSYTPNTVSNTEFKLTPSFSTTENDGFTFAGDTITITKAGDYSIQFGVSLQGANGSDWIFKCRKNGVALTTGNLAVSTTGSGNYIAGEWFYYLVGLAVGDDISFSVTNEGGSDDPTFRSIKVYMKKEPE